MDIDRYKRPTLLTLRPAILLMRSHISVTKYGPWSLSGGFSLIAAVEVAFLEIGVSQQRSQATLFLSVTNLFVTTSSRPWNLDTFENGSHNKRPRRESENRFWKKTYVKVRVKTDFEKYYCKSESDECSSETLLPQSRGTPLQLLQQLQLLIKKRKGLHWLVQWTILTIQLWSLFWERKVYSFVGTT